jgi:hypothetical protein
MPFMSQIAKSPLVLRQAMSLMPSAGTLSRRALPRLRHGHAIKQTPGAQPRMSRRPATAAFSLT